MTPTHAVPTTTIPAIREAEATRQLMADHVAEAQRIYDRARRGGLSRSEALAKARRPIRAGRFVQELRRAELANAQAAA